MIRSFLSSVDSTVGLDVLKIVLGYFKDLTRKMVSSGLWNYCRMYRLSFSLKFLYWYLASLCLAVVPKNAPTFSTSPLKFPINDVYDGRLKHLTRLSRPWWPPLPLQLSRPCPRPLFLALDFLVLSETRVVVVPLPILLLLPAAGGTVSVSGVIVIYLFSE